MSIRLCFVSIVLGTLHCGIKTQVTTLGHMVSIHIFPKTNKCVNFCSYYLYRRNYFTKLQENMAGRQSPTPLARVEPNNEDPPNNNIVNFEILQTVRDLQEEIMNFKTQEDLGLPENSGRLK